MLEWLGDYNAAALVGLVGGVLLGLAARLGRFCTLGAIEDMLYAGSQVRMRMWGIAVGTAITGTFLLMSQGLIEAPRTVYLMSTWVPWASVAGGLVFGYGMALAGNCGFGALSRLGGGDLRAFVIVLVMGLSAYVAISGPLAKLRVTLFGARDLDPGETLPTIPHLVESLTGLSPSLVGIVIGLGLIAAMFTSPEMRAARKEAFWAMVAGLAIVSGWAGTQWILNTGFTAIPLESHTYSAPLGDTILYLMTASGVELNFGVGSVAGVILGAFIGSTWRGRFRWEACEDPRELKRQIGGAVLMGLGGAVAVGCSIGQGLTAFSLLYYGAPVTYLAIMLGAALGLRQLISGFAPAE